MQKQTNFNSKQNSKQSYQDVKFFSVSKFVEFMKTKYENIDYMFAYFETSSAFKNRFGRICVKPVFFKLFINKETTYIKHSEILEMFESQPIISYSEGKTKYLPKNKEGLYYITIFFTTKEWNGVKYHPTKINETKSENNVKLIREQEITTVPIIEDDDIIF